MNQRGLGLAESSTWVNILSCLQNKSRAPEKGYANGMQCSPPAGFRKKTLNSLVVDFHCHYLEEVEGEMVNFSSKDSISLYPLIFIDEIIWFKIIQSK